MYRLFIFSLLALVLLYGCEKDEVNNVKPEPKPEPDELTYPEFLEAVWDDFDRHYSYFEYKNINWDSLKVVYTEKAQEANDYDDFIEHVLKEMLAELKDLHVAIIDKNDDFIRCYTPPVEINFRYDSAFMANYLPEEYKTTSNQIFSYKIMDNNIGYINIASWTSETDVIEFNRHFTNNFDTYNGCKGLIIDVRTNTGGKESLAREIAGRFASESQVYAYRKYRNGNEHDDFSPLQSAEFAPSGEQPYTKPVVLLIGDGCMSSNESFILMMKTLPHVTTVGDTTRGSSARPIEYSTEQTKYRISSWIAYKTDRTILEDVGIFPDYPIDAKDSYIDQKDMLMEKAFDLIENISK